MGEPGFYWFEGDYLRDTAHLSNDEDLAYRRLLGAYYSKGKPLPASVERLQNIARVPIEAVKSVADEFFPVNGDGFRHNKKADKEIARRNAWLADQARKSKLGHAARYGKAAHGHATGDAHGQRPGMPEDYPEECPRGCPDAALPSPSPSPSPTPTQTHKRPLVRKAVAYSDEFTAWWSLYPRKESKGKAWEAWKRIASPRPSAAALASALEWQRNSDQWVKDGGQFIPLPATYLNARKWEDEPPPRRRDAFLDGDA